MQRKEGGLTEFLCPNTTSLPVEGYYGSSSDFSYVKFMIERCEENDLINAPNKNDTDGKPLNKCFGDHDVHSMLNLVTINSNVDFAGDVNSNVLESNMDTTNIVLLDPRADRRTNIFYMNVDIELNDSIY